MGICVIELSLTSLNYLGTTKILLFSMFKTRISCGNDGLFSNYFLGTNRGWNINYVLNIDTTRMYVDSNIYMTGMSGI